MIESSTAFPREQLQSKVAKWQVEKHYWNQCITVHDFFWELYVLWESWNPIQLFPKNWSIFSRFLIYRHSVLEIDGLSSLSEEPNVVCEYFYVISPDKKHEQHLVFHAHKNWYLRNCLGKLANSVGNLGY